MTHDEWHERRKEWMRERRALLRALEDANAALAHHCIRWPYCERCQRYLATLIKLNARYFHGDQQWKKEEEV